MKEIKLKNGKLLKIYPAKMKDAEDFANYINQMVGESNFLTLSKDDGIATTLSQGNWIESSLNNDRTHILMARVDGLLVGSGNISPLSKKVRLSTYAIWWIKASINDFILRSWSLVKIGTVAAQKKLFYNLSRIKARLGLYENKELEPTVVKQIANELVVEEQEVVEMNRRLSGDTSLNVTIGDDEDRERQDLLVDSRQNVEEALARKQEAKYKHQILMSCLGKLSEREAFIVKNRMLTDEPMTLEDIGTKYEISRERVRQIEKKAFEHLAELVKQEVA